MLLHLFDVPLAFAFLLRHTLILDVAILREELVESEAAFLLLGAATIRRVVLISSLGLIEGVYSEVGLT